MSEPCACDTGLAYSQCCGLYHQGAPAPDAKALMRSRYCAYVQGNIDYLIMTTLPIQQAGLDQESIRQWSAQSQWLGLEVLEHEVLPNDPNHSYVSFNARWQDSSGAHTQFERSAFTLVDRRWYFLDPTVPLKANRNDACPCGGGLKFKKCCSAFL